MKKFTIVLALLIISIVCCAGCINPQEPVVPVDPVDPITPIEPVEPELPVEEYSVLFMMNYDDAGAYAAETVTAGDTVSKPAAPTRSGYTFTGWFTAVEGGVVYDFTQPVNADTMLYAQWKKKSSSGGSSHSHNWGEGVVTDEATCVDSGVITYTCSCGQTKTAVIPANGHTPVEEDEDGKLTVKCSAGDKIYNAKLVTLANEVSYHTEVSYAVTNASAGDTIHLAADMPERLDLTQAIIVSAHKHKVNLSYTEESHIKILKENVGVVDVTLDREPVDLVAIDDSEFLVICDRWDGTSDTSWYDPENPKTEYTFTTGEQLMGLSELVSGETTFKGVTFKLDNDLDLYAEDTSASADGDPVTFRPIGDHSKDGTFEGTFDGQGHTISNLYQNGWDLGYEWGAYGSYGLFGNVNDATIKNLKISGSESYIEGGDTSFVTGSATGTCVFENITIEDSISATYNNGNGGIIGWSGAGTYTFKNIKIGSDVVLAGLWGSFDSSIGGIVGQAEPGATYNFENVDIACRIDAYNDCTASYDYYNYRMCGMIIGRLAETTTIDRANYPDTTKYNINCNGVTVTYGDWANYHYCEPTPADMNGGRGMRVEPGYAYDGLPADYDHSQCVANHMNLIPFDQIFGGAQLGVKGLKEYEGVTVVYNNK